jgi:hypothetical protein
MSEQSAKKPRIAAAAEALIEAACLEADAFTKKKLAENLESLKSSFDSNLNRVVQKLDASSENFDAKINTLNQHVAGLKSDIGALRTLMEDEYKQTRLQRALTLVELNSFTYYAITQDYYGATTQKNSSDLTKTIIRWFMLGSGCNLPDARMEQYPKNEEESKKLFRQKLTKQVIQLINREPRLEQSGDKWTIYYS